MKSSIKSEKGKQRIPSGETIHLFLAEQTRAVSGCCFVCTHIPGWKNPMLGGHTESQNHMALTRKQYLWIEGKWPKTPKNKQTNKQK